MGLLLHKPNATDLDLIITLCKEGKITPAIDRCYPLNEVSKAIRCFAEGRAKGKVIIAVEHNKLT
jgi:NADPH:quinone reductase-like Zn-dependent oxidoreductase